MMEESEIMCPSSRVLSPFREETGDEVLSALPRHTKVIITGNNRTKSVLVGLQGVVKKAVGSGGWHWLILKNGIEVKLQRNALSVLEHPSGNEDDDHIDFNSSSGSGSETGAKDHDFSSAINFPKISKPRVRRTRPRSTESVKPMNRGMLYRDVQSIIQSPQLKVNFMKLGTDSLWKYCKHYKLVGVNSDTPWEEMKNIAERHFSSHQQRLTEAQVIVNFVRAAKKMKWG